ncbi:uncharacterized protein HD556DRAFT_1213730, partial [Suillus plorans]
EIARKLPVWFHLGASSDLNKLNNHLYANCLRQVHKVYTVGQLENLARRQDPDHKKNKECPCSHCSLDRSIQCKKPFKCMQLMKRILTCILPKWNPATCTTPYMLTISPEQFTTIGNDQDDQDQTPCIFNPVLPSPETLDEGFRIFSASDPPCTILASQTKVHQRAPPELIKITITGTHNVNKDGDHESGGSVWFRTRDTCNLSIKIPEELAAPGTGEAGALL